MILKKLKGAAGAVTDAAKAAADSAGNLVSGVNEATFGRLFTEVEIPGFLLPTGPNPDDYILEFDFEAALKSLRSGILVKPRLVIIAGRDDMDPELLAHRLNNEFGAAFSAAKTRSREEVAGPAEKEFAEIHANKAQAADQSAEAASTVIVGLIGIFLALNPIADIIFLLIAVYKGKDAVRTAFRYASFVTKGLSNKGKTHKKLHDIEKEFGGKEGAFEEAVSNLEVHIHPRLAQLVNEMIEVNGGHLTFSSRMEIDFPDVDNLLRSPAYQNNIEEALRPLLA